MLNLFVGQQRKFDDGQFAGIVTPEALAPTTSEVVQTYIEDAFVGELTAKKLLESKELSEYEERGEPLTEEQWRESSFYRTSLSYYPQMTTAAAEFLAQKKDEEAARDDVMSRASGWQTAAGVASSLGAGVFEPLNLATGLATLGGGTLLLSLKRVGTAVNRLRRFGKYAPAAAMGVGEAAVATGLIEAISAPAQERLQSDYDTADSLMNFGASMLLGVGFNVGGVFFRERIRAREFRREQARLDGVVQQIVSGKRPDVDAIDNAEFLSGYRGAEVAFQNEIDDIQITALRKIEELRAQKESIDDDLFGLLTRKRDVLSDMRSVGRPKSLSAFLRQEGGVQEFSDELKSIGVTSKTHPGLVSKRGLSLDEAGLRAYEAGYFSERPTTAEFLEALDADFNAAPRVPARDVDRESYIASLQNELLELERALGEYNVGDEAVFFRDLSQRAAINENIDDAIVRLEAEANDRVRRMQSTIREQQSSSSDPLYDDRDFSPDERFYNNAEEVDVTGRMEEVDIVLDDLREQGLVSEDEVAYFEKLDAVKEDDLRSAYVSAQNCLLRG